MQIADRPNGATWPVTAAEARGFIRDLEAEVQNEKRRKKIAAFFAKNIAGKLSPEAIQVYADYAA